MQVWGALKDGRLSALCFVRFEDWNGETVARVIALCGERMGEWIGLLEPLKQVLSQLGATRVVAEGRKGWQRRFKVIRQVYEI